MNNNDNIYNPIINKKKSSNVNSSNDKIRNNKLEKDNKTTSYIRNGKSKLISNTINKYKTNIIDVHKILKNINNKDYKINNLINIEYTNFILKDHIINLKKAKRNSTYNSVKKEGNTKKIESSNYKKRMTENNAFIPNLLLYDEDKNITNFERKELMNELNNIIDKKISLERGGVEEMVNKYLIDKKKEQTSIKYRKKSFKKK